MSEVQAIILFILGVGAAFLAYFAWYHIFGPSAPQDAVSLNNVVPFRVGKPGIASQR